MAVYSTVKGLFTAIADAVRAQDGTTEPINRVDLPARIRGIKTSPEKVQITDAAYLFSGQVPIALAQYIKIVEPSAMNHMFFGNDANIEIDMTKMDFTPAPNAVAMNNIFYTCDKLEAVKLPAGLHASSLMSAFQGCTSITGIDMNGIDVSSCRDYRSFLNGCKNITSFDGSVFPDLYVVNNNCQLFFSATTSMQKVWIPKEWHCPNSSVGYSPFMSNGGSNAMNKDLIVYTDASSEAAQIAAGNWSQYTLCYSSNGSKVPDAQIRYGATHDEYLAG